MNSLAGSFLIAKIKLQDPSFKQAVVLLLQHGPEGAFGLIVNRPAKADELPFPVCFGGPCQSEGLMMLHGHAQWLASPGGMEQQVAPGIYVGDAAALERVSENESAEELRYRVFIGYAGWGPGQLESELATGAWATTPANAEILFDTPLEDLWLNLLPPRLPEPSLN